MKFQIDHDLHIHSLISPCAGNDPRQTPEAILSYGLTNEFRLLNLADHFWDEKAPCEARNIWLNCGNDLARARSVLPLPQSKSCKFLFGMEVDMDYKGNLAVSREEMDSFDFLVFAPSHLHLKGFAVPDDTPATIEAYKKAYIDRMDILLKRDDIPWHKTGLAHPTIYSVVPGQDPLLLYDSITDREWESMWVRVRDRGMGVEINMKDLSPEDAERSVRPLRIARAVGCKFYLGSDAHMPEETCGIAKRFSRYAEMLGLTEEDKLPFIREQLAQA